MKEIEYLRSQAAELRKLAQEQSDPELKRDLLALAERCEHLAKHMHGNGTQSPGS